MTDAPKRIWAVPDMDDVPRKHWDCGVFRDDRDDAIDIHGEPIIEYTRSDLVEGYDYLFWFFQNADFGPADLDVRLIMQERYELTTGERVPNDLRE